VAVPAARIQMLRTCAFGPKPARGKPLPDAGANVGSHRKPDV
jgi:hypothetical protein